MGADVVLNYKEQDVVSEIKKLTGGGADVGIEALGTQETFEACLRSVHPGGVVSSLGVYSGHLKVPLDAFASGLGDHTIVTTLCPGGKERMLGISKRGDAYLRSLLIHGARAVIRTARAKDDPLSRWVIRLADRSHPNVAAAALANKTTRIAWAMLSRGTNYQPAVN